jgi:hypothetical protein
LRNAAESTRRSTNVPVCKTRVDSVHVCGGAVWMSHSDSSGLYMSMADDGSYQYPPLDAGTDTKVGVVDLSWGPDSCRTLGPRPSSYCG